MQKTTTSLEQKKPPDGIKADSNSPIMDEKWRLVWLLEGKIVDIKKGNIAVRARSTIKFIFQILLWIFLYSIVLSSLMILKTDASPHVHILLILISFCAIGVGISITLYIFYPLIAPRIFDFHHGVFYTKPLSFYIYTLAWDSIHIIPLDSIQAIQIIRTEESHGKKKKTVDQTNIILEDGERVALMIRKNAPFSHTAEDAQKLATRLIVPVLNEGIVTL